MTEQMEEKSINYTKCEGDNRSMNLQSSLVMQVTGKGGAG